MYAYILVLFISTHTYMSSHTLSLMQSPKKGLHVNTTHVPLDMCTSTATQKIHRPLNIWNFRLEERQNKHKIQKNIAFDR